MRLRQRLGCQLQLLVLQLLGRLLKPVLCLLQRQYMAAARRLSLIHI